MKLIAFLKKIGLLRYGAAAATYKSAKDAPDMLVTDLYGSRNKETPVAHPDEATQSD